MITLLICRNCSLLLSNHCFDNPAIQEMHSRTTNERFEKMKWHTSSCIKSESRGGGIECTSWLISGDDVTFKVKHHSNRIWDPRASYSTVRDLFPQGISTGLPSSQQIYLESDFNTSLWCFHIVFCSMNAILACFDVLAVLVLKRAKIAFIGQKNNKKKTSQRHLFMKYSLHGFDCCQCAVYGDVNLDDEKSKDYCKADTT